MLDHLLGGGFSYKCKSSIKLIRCRIEIIRKKRNSLIRFMKNDIVELINAGFDVNAYGRADRLIKEVNLSSCYDLIEQYCGRIMEQLLFMQKQRDCPPQCREPVSTLIYAAARISDLPELRNLRHLFSEKYGNTSESSVHEEFVNKIVSKPPSTEQKIQLLQEISQEFSINWDSKALEEITKPSALPRNDPNKIKPRLDSNDVSPHAKWKVTPGAGYTTKQEENTESECVDPIARNDHDNLPLDYELTKNAKTKIAYSAIPPPYVKPTGMEHGTDADYQRPSSDHQDPSRPSVADDYSFDHYQSESAQRRFNHANQQTEVISDAPEGHRHDDTVSKPKPRSERTKNLKPVIQEKSIAVEGNEQENRNQKARSGEGGGVKDYNDEEEEMLDRLLTYYSKKPSNYEDVTHFNSKSGLANAKSTSIPLKRMTPASIQTDTLGSIALHVHPNLPEYDELANRVAALKDLRNKG